jgi:phosphotransferase system enzyme I (PtsI)
MEFKKIKFIKKGVSDMIKFTGKGVYGALAIGKISVFKRREANVRRIRITDTEAEKARVETAKAMALGQLSEIYEKALKEVGEANAQIFEIHMMMIEDDDYNDAIANVIDSQSVNAEYAVAVTADNFADMFASMDDSYMQARAADVKDISNRIIACMSGTSSGSEIGDDKVIICADDLAPSETVSLDKDKVLAFVTAYGSSNSHTAILARNMNIPAVIGVGEEFLKAIKDGDTAAVDGYSGEIFLDPDEPTLEAVRKKQNTDLEKKKLLQELRGKENITLDGTRVNIFANIGGVENIGAVLLNDAGGIGLFRSEFLYLENDDFPTEDQQFAAYKKVLESMAGRKVIIRTLDIGADKQADYFNLDKEENPALGLRAIRICLTRPEIFKTQLRALYRASVFGKLGIMFPMITSTTEIEEILAICEEVKAELRNEGISYADNIEIGIMIETPAAAVISDRLAPLVDFFSVGTNDLTQYTLACDRQNPKLERFCDTHHEAILRLIEMSAENAHKHGAWIGICGELAADTTLTERFLRMGIDELSVSPTFVLKLRDTVRNLDLSKQS